MEVSRGQAMVMDGLFFLMLCGLAAATLMWAGSVYGNKSFEAYRYIYMTDYASGALQVLSQLDYGYSAGAGGGTVKANFLNEMGKYMQGEFNESDARYGLMVGKWETLCKQSPAPILLTIYTDARDAACGTRDKPIYLSCGGLLDRLEGDGGINVFKYPYYSSPAESKSCDALRCEMDIKIYY